MHRAAGGPTLSAALAELEGRPIHIEIADVNDRDAGTVTRAARVRTLAAILSLSALASTTAATQRSPLTLPLTDPAYALLEGLENSGCLAARVGPYKPYDVGRVRSAIAKAQGDSRCAPALVSALVLRFGPATDSTNLPAVIPGSWRNTPPFREPVFTVGAAGTVTSTALGRGEFRPLWDDLREKSAGSPPISGALRVRGRYIPTRAVAAVLEAYGQTHSRNDPTVRARTLRSTSGVVGISEATLNGVVGPVTISFGRDRETWMGPGIESIVLSAQGPPLDRLMASLSTEHFEARALYGMLDDVVLDESRGELPVGTPSQRFHRSIAAHALTWMPTEGVEITAGETVLLSRGSRTIELGYANPLMPYVLTQHDAGTEGNEVRDNLGVFVGFRSQFRGSRFAGEFLIDDIQIDAADREVTPHQLAWRAEARQGWASRFPGSVAVEYTRVDSYTYLRGLYTDVYQFNDRPLGSELGPDADRIEGSVEMWLNGPIRLTSHVAQWRRGAQRIFARPAVGAVGNAGQPFPTTTPERPTAQNTLLVGFGAELNRWDFPISVGVESARVRSPGHVAGGSAQYFRAHLTATYAFRYP